MESVLILDIQPTQGPRVDFFRIKDCMGCSTACFSKYSCQYALRFLRIEIAMDVWGDMEGMDYWRLCDELSVAQAALLIVGVEPTSSAESNAERSVHKPTGYEAALTALKNALRSGAVKGHIRPTYEYDMNGNIRGEEEGSIGISESQIDVASLRTWLSARGFTSGFFFPEKLVTQDYLNPKDPRYPPKLAAAIFAWQAVGDEAATKGKSPKQALTKWLREHASEFGLTDDEGRPNETGIEEAAKVANWQMTGGAPKTPAG